MPHIHTEPGQIDHTVTAYIFRLDREEPLTLLHMHRKLGKLLPVGGHIELNETPWGAMAHELEEESGYRLDDLDVLQPKLRIGQYPEVAVHPQPLLMNTHDISSEHYHSDIAYLFVANGEPSSTPDDGESIDLRWLSRAQVAELSRDEIWNNTQGTCLAVFDSFLDEWEPVPATDFRINTVA